LRREARGFTFPIVCDILGGYDVVRGRGKESGGEGIQSPFEIRTYCIDRIAREWNSMDEDPGLVRAHPSCSRARFPSELSERSFKVEHALYVTWQSLAPQRGHRSV